MNPAALFAGGLAAGLAAGAASCAAVQGGLLIGLVSPSGSPRSRPRALAPVAAFLTGRLAAHTALGALLGLAGAVVQVGPRVRAALLVAAGTTVSVLAVRTLRRRRGTGCDGRPPAGCGHGHDEAPCGAPRHPPPSGSSAPALARAATAGMATIFVPCGVTLSMEVVAVSSGSALGGAATLVGLALGTAPALAALGLLVRALASTRLAALAGVAALAAGLFTAGSGLRLGGWLPDLAPPPPGSRTAATGRALTGADGVQRLTIWATAEGFRPGIAVAAAGRPLDIAFRTKDNRGCTRALAIGEHDVVLPVTGERVVRLPAHPEGRLRYACGMGMYVGFVRFERVP
ncbi:MAG: sulfite exporter TauE/SafE family protein [Microbispora sp.]|nr:sulfite exporter TauE/SafE family protein [Microbispora sp.]